MGCSSGGAQLAGNCNESLQSSLSFAAVDADFGSILACYAEVIALADGFRCCSTALHLT